MSSLSDNFKVLNRQLDSLFTWKRQQPVFQWATVVSVSPLQIRYDGETDPVAGTPDRTVTGLQVGDRVWCQRIHRRDIILGVAKGGDTGWKPISLASGYTTYLSHTPEYRLINGILYLRGAVAPTSGDLSVTGQNVFTNAIPELVSKVSNADEYNVAPCLGPTGGTIMRVYVNRFGQLVFGGSSGYGSGSASYMSLAGASGKFHFN